jgi:hypothetical protein
MTGFPAVNEGERYGTMQYLNDSHDEIKKIKAHYDFTMIPASKKKKEKKVQHDFNIQDSAANIHLCPNL